LRKVPESPQRAKNSLRISETWLDESSKAYKAGAINASILSSYLVMFHAARAVLFNDGFREKSHFCISLYLEEMYVSKGKLEQKWVSLLDHYRELRHASQYQLNVVTSLKDAEDARTQAGLFLERLKPLVVTA